MWAGFLKILGSILASKAGEKKEGVKLSPITIGEGRTKIPPLQMPEGGSSPLAQKAVEKGFETLLRKKKQPATGEWV